MIKKTVNNGASNMTLNSLNTTNYYEQLAAFPHKPPVLYNKF